MLYKQTKHIAQDSHSEKATCGLNWEVVRIEMTSTTRKAVITVLISLSLGLLARGGVAPAQNSEGLTIPTELLTSKLKKRNPAFAISVESVLQKVREQQEIILIDVRKGDEFEKFRIPGSINIPLFAIKTKVFLESKFLVLISEGYNYSQLERECEHLRKSGFRVSLLKGGLYYWKQKGAPIKGDPFAQKDLNRVPPAIFFTEKDYEDWLMIDISTSKDSEARSLVPRSISIPYSNDAEMLISEFQKALAKHKKYKQRISLLIFNEKGEQYNRIEKLVQKTRFRNVFFLKGGIEAYKRFLEQQATLRQAKDNPRKTVKKCATCP